MRISKTMRPVLTALLLSGIWPALCAAQPAGTSPVYQLRPGLNQISIYERFTSVLQHSANIKTVLDFDGDVLQIDVVQGNAQQIRVSALSTGVTTVTIMDEFDQYFKVEVLVKGDVRHLESYIRRRFPDDDVDIEEINGAILLGGWVTKPDHISDIVEIAEQFYPNVLNHMRIGGVQQVMLKCQIIEVQRSKIRRFGMNFDILGSNNYFVSTPGPITPIENLSVGAGGPSLGLTGFSDSTITFGFINGTDIFQGFVRALREEGLLKIHATPMLVTHNGQPAKLLNGGETPVIVPAGLGTTAIEFKEFGVQMEAVPRILGNGRVHLQIKPTVSERDFSNAVTVDGVTVPAFTVREADTQVEMNFGETLVIAGLLSTRSDAATSKVPFFGEIPWVGAAFSRKRFTESETELIIMVTPEYASPIPHGQIPQGGPGKFTDVPTDHELYFHNQIEIPLTGEPCDVCFNCTMNGGTCPRHPNGCPDCRNNTDCVQTKPAASPLIRPGSPKAPSNPTADSNQTPTTVPAGFSEPNKVKSKQTQESSNRTGSTRSRNRRSSPGLISPLMR